VSYLIGYICLPPMSGHEFDFN